MFLNNTVKVRSSCGGRIQSYVGGSFTARCICLVIGVWALFILASMPAIAALPMIVDDPEYPSSITLTDPFVYVLRQNYDAAYIYGGSYDGFACFGYIDHTSHVPKKVTFNLAVVDATGFVIGENTLVADGIGSPNTCQNYASTVYPRIGSFGFTPNRQTALRKFAAIYVSAQQIIYDDGSTWQAEKRSKVGDKKTLPFPQSPLPASSTAGMPAVSAINVPDAPFTIVDAFPCEDGIGATFGSMRRDFGACVAFDSGPDPKRWKTVRAALAIVDRSGIVVNIQTVDLRRGFSVGSEFRYLPGPIDHGSYEFAGSKNAARIQITRILAMPLLEEFTDGTMWIAPKPFVVGQPAP
jgi:hypothetical protein